MIGRRKFLKLMGGIAALPALGKFASAPKKAAVVKKGIQAAEKMSETQSILPDVIATVMRKGKEFDTGMPGKSHIGKQYKGVKVTETPDEIYVEFTTDSGSSAFANIKKADYVVDEATGKSTYVPPDYEEGQQVYRAFSKDDYVKDVEFEILDSVNDLKKIAMEGKEPLTIKRQPVKKADGGRVGLQAGGPPIYQTSDPKEAIKEIIRRTPTLGGGTIPVPIYSGDQTQVDFLMGAPNDQFKYGISALTPYGEVSTVRGQDNAIRGEYGFSLQDQTGPNVNYYLGYDSDRGPRFDIRYEKRFANGGLTDTIPPEKGPMSQGIESLFQTR